DYTPFTKVKVVLLGQDPYHGQGQAHGLCFSVPMGVPKPPSLVNIFKELHDDLGLAIPPHGNLEAWARQGVLLLNATLTVRANQAGSHQHKGWEQFTDAAIRALAEQRENLVFMLWGNYAQAKAELVDGNKHCILKAPHPSPFSANQGFFGCRHFSRANDFLIRAGKEPVDWQIS
ncbi:MAG: uracil-DNA glycosylase, partial [Chlamydiales bacterium]|nr:uracil-DNA glycosylase [Chlamydiales bacterium]